MPLNTSCWDCGEYGEEGYAECGQCSVGYTVCMTCLDKYALLDDFHDCEL